MGRKPIEMKLIENKKARHVSFSKRKVGLFKKLAELCFLSRAQAAALVYTPAGNLHLFAQPHESPLFHRFTAGEDNVSVSTESGRERKKTAEFRASFAEFLAVVEAEKDRRRWWEEMGFDGFPLEKLLEMHYSLADLRIAVLGRMAHLEREREE